MRLDVRTTTRQPYGGLLLSPEAGGAAFASNRKRVKRLLVREPLTC
jgi:hypothetical protein